MPIFRKKMSFPSERLRLNNGYEQNDNEHVKQGPEIKMKFFKPNLNDPLNTETLPSSPCLLTDSEHAQIDSLKSVILKYLTKNYLIGENMGCSRPILTNGKIHRNKKAKITRNGYRPEIDTKQNRTSTKRHLHTNIVILKISETIESSAIKVEFSKYGEVKQIFRNGRLCAVMFEIARAASDAAEKSRVRTRLLKFNT